MLAVALHPSPVSLGRCGEKKKIMVRELCETEAKLWAKTNEKARGFSAAKI